MFLHLSRERLYYAGHSRWVGDRKQALNLETIANATELGQSEGHDSMVIVVTSGDPSCDWFVPLIRKCEGPPGAPQASGGARLDKAA